MSSFTAVDLSRLPAPAIVEQIDHEVIFADMLAHLRQLDPQFDALVESDPLYKALQVCAYREMILRQRNNESCRAIMLAYARGSDLDHLGALMGVARLQIDPGDPANSIPPTMESDADFRRRIQLGPEGFSVAGPAGAYVFHALGADPDVADASVTSPAPDDIRAIVFDVLASHGATPALVTAMTDALDAATWPGEVEVFVLARNESGVPSAETLAAVEAALSAESVRPLTDQVSVAPVEVIEYTVEAELEVHDGPDPALVRQASQAAVEAYVVAQRRIGLPVTRSGLFAELHRNGVRNVTLLQPAADILVTDRQVAVCTGVSVGLA